MPGGESRCKRGGRWGEGVEGMLKHEGREIRWMAGIRFRPEQRPTKQTYLSMLDGYHNAEYREDTESS